MTMKRNRIEPMMPPWFRSIPTSLFLENFSQSIIKHLLKSNLNDKMIYFYGIE